MKLVLLLNNFVFNGLNYLRIKECAMGTNSAPSYANIFIGKFEETFIYPFITNLHKIYNDDIFINGQELGSSLWVLSENSIRNTPT